MVPQWKECGGGGTFQPPKGTWETGEYSFMTNFVRISFVLEENQLSSFHGPATEELKVLTHSATPETKFLTFES